MFFLKLYFFLAILFYIMMGVILIKDKKAKPISLIGLVFISVLWLPAIIYSILTYKE